mmetsp:Transcript_41483/g.83078  ORF Transcript_41483/g.83078 Transcript_41483/m.83078 type:complete len:306 (+) Transcript_41483:68-985(+)
MLQHPKKGTAQAAASLNHSVERARVTQMPPRDDGASGLGPQGYGSAPLVPAEAGGGRRRLHLHVHCREDLAAFRREVDWDLAPPLLRAFSWNKPAELEDRHRHALTPARHQTLVALAEPRPVQERAVDREGGLVGLGSGPDRHCQLHALQRHRLHPRRPLAGCGEEGSRLEEAAEPDGAGAEAAAGGAGGDELSELRQPLEKIADPRVHLHLGRDSVVFAPARREAAGAEGGEQLAHVVGGLLLSAQTLVHPRQVPAHLLQDAACQHHLTRDAALDRIIARNRLRLHRLYRQQLQPLLNARAQRP